MLKKLWAAYSDFITLGWLFRMKPEIRGRVIAFIVVCACLPFLADGVVLLQPGTHGMTKGGFPLSRELTIAYGVLTLSISVPIFLITLCALVGLRPLYHLEHISLLRWPVSYFRFAREYRRTGNPWSSTRCGAAHKLFGLGSNHAFNWYLTGKSSYLAGSLDGVCDFLRRCQYVSDEEEFDSWDFWQHPIEFEHRMRGDCEDHALWAWRKLRDLGVDADFVCGRQITPTRPAPGGGHAWVVVRTRTETLLLETTTKSARPMLRPLADVQASYIPGFSVDGKCQVRVYGGYLAQLKRRTTRVPLD